jgi:hypothetical protein
MYLNAISNNKKMHGVVEGVSYQQNERVDELNTRISSRYFSDVPLEPNYNPRPVPTKYSIFPIVDRKKPILEQQLKYVNHEITTNFNPATRNGPPKSYFNNVDTETILRNQAFSLQNAEQSVYIPSTKSDLYNVTVVSSPATQPYPLLFSNPDLDKSVHPNLAASQIGKNKFFNHTRNQLRDGL